MNASFKIFGISHLAVLTMTIALSLVLIFTMRVSKKEYMVRVVSIILFYSILCIFIIRFIYKNYGGRLSLPMHLCDWSAIVVMITLVTRRYWAFELAYFWGLAGPLHALITPVIKYDFPNLNFVLFFLYHSSVIIGVAYLIFSLKMSPQRGAVIRAFIRSQVYLITALIVDILLQSNYGYLLRKPSGSTLFDYLGPWPLYIIALEAIALASYLIYYLPFYYINKKRI
jgi:hypothetical integral membrane protein (TIGR02206 family)